MTGSPLFGSKVITSIPFRVALLKSPPEIVPSLFSTVPVNVPPLMVPLLSFMTSFVNVPFRMVPLLVTLLLNVVLRFKSSPVIWSLFVNSPLTVPPSAFSVVLFVILPSMVPPRKMNSLPLLYTPLLLSSSLWDGDVQFSIQPLSMRNSPSLLMPPPWERKLFAT